MSKRQFRFAYELCSNQKSRYFIPSILDTVYLMWGFKCKANETICQILMYNE